jgi:Restriction endonuclease
MNRINIKRAIALLVSGKAEPLDFNNGIGWPVRSPSLVLYVPEQIRLRMASQERLWKVPSVNRKEVLKRDHHRCQYCGTTHNLTLDHVIPRRKVVNIVGIM